MLFVFEIYISASIGRGEPSAIKLRLDLASQDASPTTSVQCMKCWQVPVLMEG